MALVDLKCRNKCSGILGRAHLEGESTVEVKCDKCREITSFKAEPVAIKFMPNGAGGFFTVPAGR